MFYSLGVEDCFESIYRAAKTTLFKTGRSDHQAFIRMETLKPALARLTQEEQEEEEQNQELKAHTLNGGPEDAQIQRLQQSLAHLGAIDPTLLEIFDLVVTKIQVTDDTAMANRRSLGQVHIHRKKGWTLWDDWDALVENLSHQLLLLDETHSPHYLSTMDQDELLKAEKLRDLVFQVVGSCEVLCFRQKVHRIFFPETDLDSFTERLKACDQALDVLCEMMQTHPTTPRLAQIIIGLQSKLSHLKEQ